MFRMLKCTIFFCIVSLTCLIFGKNVVSKEKIVIPDNVIEYCEKYGEEYEISPEFLEAICWHETRCRAELENAGCKGMCQISEKYHKKEMELLGLDDLYDAEQNIHLCAYIIRQLANENDDPYYVLMCYNCGSNRGKRLYEQGKFTKYAKEVCEESYQLEREHRK